MLIQLLEGSLLITVTVAIHVVTLSWCIERLQGGRLAHADSLPWITIVLARIAIIVILAHLGEILIWSFYFWARGVIADFESAFYFSAVTYATIGYGDIVPPPAWRLIAAMEGLTGILMCAWSGGFFFAVVSRLFDRSQHGERRT